MGEVDPELKEKVQKYFKEISERSSLFIAN
ncbi:MAG: hypothetical protein Ct9H90mP20_3170 [Candidatus Neomarinimicrobiota bacterium]|nr:MAG: hypothetical protein Ct9H90mP20_3170 [Candidatus Neomarinimicrobiota bacterium]